MTHWIDRAAALLGESIRQHQAMSGGDVAAVARLELASGAVVVAKASPQAPQEATMLRRLAAAGVPTPEVLAEDNALLVLSLIHHDGRVETSWQDLGRVFARLHQTTGPHYGWHADYAFGDVPILNTPCDHWPTFWGQQRLLPLIADLPSRVVLVTTCSWSPAVGVQARSRTMRAIARSSIFICRATLSAPAKSRLRVGCRPCVQ